jgi:hypothetical protein
MSNNTKTNTNTNTNAIRFSSQESIYHYTSIFYKFTEEEVIKNGGILSICGYCRCKGNDKNNCDCLNKMIQSINK